MKDKDRILKFRPVSDFNGEHFFIPDYQRGYRWTEREVSDLLNDVSLYHKKYPDQSYSMQPIVVKYLDTHEWEVVDGQQRLTTILLIMQALGHKDYYNLNYAVLENSKDHVANISECPESLIKSDINLYHMKQAKETVTEWVKTNIKEGGPFADKGELFQFVESNLKFLWYRADKVDDSPGEKIFRRLNIGKIELTQSELIKALFLSDDNYSSKPVDTKAELARQWDVFEATLQNDEFWLFFTNEKNYSSSTRIDYILNFICQLNKDTFFYDVEIDLESRDGLFRAYYDVYVRDRNRFFSIWKEITEVMDIICQWFDDVIFYHLIGFLIERGTIISTLLRKWKENTAFDFLSDYLVDECLISNLLGKFDIRRNYLRQTKSGSYIDEKRQAFPFLLLSNILQVLRQNITHKRNPDYAQGFSYKFPFHLFKKTVKKSGCGWDVEHIDSATTNELEDYKSKKEWICSAFLSLDITAREIFNEEQKTKLIKFFNASGKGDDDKVIQRNFNALHEAFKKAGIMDCSGCTDKNFISNFVLLDYATNRNYKNAIFPTKRQHIRNKGNGMIERAEWDSSQQRIISHLEVADSAFVPPCTKDAFLKAYSSVPGEPMKWSDADAAAYGKYITDLFEWFKSKEWIKNAL